MGLPEEIPPKPLAKEDLDDFEHRRWDKWLKPDEQLWFSDFIKNPTLAFLGDQVSSSSPLSTLVNSLILDSQPLLQPAIVENFPVPANSLKVSDQTASHLLTNLELVSVPKTLSKGMMVMVNPPKPDAQNPFWMGQILKDLPGEEYEVLWFQQGYKGDPLAWKPMRGAGKCGSVHISRVLVAGFSLTKKCRLHEATLKQWDSQSKNLNSNQ